MSWFLAKKDEIQKMIQDVDDEGSGTIGFDEFLKMMSQKNLNPDSKDEILPFLMMTKQETPLKKI